MEKGLIYQFTETKSEKKKVEEPQINKDGEEEIVIKNKTVKTPVDFVVLKPTRRLMDEAEAQYAIELSKNIKRGIVTKAMMIKKYADTGGTLTEDESKDMVRRLQRSNELSNEIQMLTAQGKTKNKKEIQEKEAELLELRRELAEIEVALQGVYEHTADARAERSMLLWYVVQLCKIKTEEGVEDFFNGLLFEDQLEDLYVKDESGDDFTKNALQKFMAIISYWFYNNSAKEEDITEFLKTQNG